MSTQDDALRLLLGEASLNDAETFVSVLRNAGHAVRPTRVEDDAELREALEGKSYDLFLCAANLSTLPINVARRLVQQSGKDIPLIVVTDTEDPQQRTDALAAGAADAVCRGDLRHLQLVVQREVRHLQDRRRLRRMELSLREVEKRCHALLDNSRDAIAYVHEGMHIYANRAYLEKFGYAGMEDIEGMPLLDMTAPEDQPRFKEFLRNYHKNPDGTAELELNMLDEQGESVRVLMTLSPASIEGEPCTQILMRDKVASQELAQQIDALSKQDMLSGLYNRQYFMEQLEQAVKRALAGSGSSLLYMHPDNLDSIRQTLGIGAIDALVADLGSLIREQTDKDSIAARFSDETFTILLPQQSVHEALALGEALLRAVEEHVTSVGDRTVTTTCSIGVAVVGERTGGAHEALNDALRACEQSRAAGGNRLQLYTPQVGTGENEAAAWAARLEAALESDGLFLVFQPISSLQGDARERYEVRVRMRGDDGEPILPAEFVGYAEETGLMPRLDRWVVDAALKALAEVRSRGHDTLLFVKVSGPSLADPGFIQFVAQMLKARRIEGERLQFQINEPVAVTQLNQAKQFFRAAKELGAGICLDHFGSGLNPFQLVKHLPADYLKLDGALTRDVSSEDSQKAIQQIIDNAHAMQKRVIAGHLQDAASLAMLWQLQTDFVQGNFLAAPEPAMNYDFSGMVI